MTMIDKINTAKPGREQAEEIVRQCRLELNKNKGQWARLVRISNGELTYPWVQAFAKGDVAMPLVTTILSLARLLGVRISAEAGAHFNKFPE